MIGLGKWVGQVNTVFFGGKISVSILDKDGSYDFSIELPENVKSLPDVHFHDVKEEGNTLSAVAEVGMLPGKTIDISLTFDGDTMNGLLKVPFIGKVRLENFKKS